MKRVFAVGGQPVVVEIEEPELRAGEVRVQTIVSAISPGTESGIIRGSVPESKDVVFAHDPVPRPKLRNNGRDHGFDRPRPSPPGHEHLGYGLAGRVVEVAPDITDIAVGDLVACSGDQAAHHAEIVCVPRNLVAKVPEGVSPDQAAFVTLGSIAMHGLRRTRCYFGETVIVYGLGLLGLITIQIARSAGIYTIGLDIDHSRFELAQSFGASATLDPRDPGVTDAVLALTDGYGADGVVMSLYTESSDPLNHAFLLCRQRAAVVGIGAFGMNIDRQNMYSRDIAFYPSLAYGPGRYDYVYEEGSVDYPIGYARWAENRNAVAVLRLIAEGKLEVGPLAPIKIPVERAPDAYALLRSPERPPTVLLTYQNA
jgi:threonine dehydrogenase-like Zn-dependent dehydrogenase